jgi:hypothetical protein
VSIVMDRICQSEPTCRAGANKGRRHAFQYVYTKRYYS